MIDKFEGEYAFLSNFYDCPVKYRGNMFKNSEAAFQAQKCSNPVLVKKFCAISASEAKKMGKKVDLRPDWELKKDEIMYEIVLAKFTQNLTLKYKLLATGDEILVEGNWWGDRYWGKCKGVGLNRLGEILMKVREELKNDKKVTKI